ncbi:MerR-family transcriptional regulator [[Actinomadura] parvosata subsp. kistnae]|uniref:MerR family transcriptional regulator n=1 Tax=[Actinomadura] parvosata subsp. kistnae TaxID=1909395 RepID=A0A1V0AHE9_9ACTN|nr:MerR family transcriptional regulator [Nonomuraea sp. ATCC 55076]AQZ69637.1 MerR family transcriptional regulator [Nonomuraea sp. ATCC 55076]SPL91662.1 MerR-family transcriptional regulator [Actinomadura parvosata subsp. kistnae]
MDGDTLYSIGDLARRTGLTVKTVRFYSDAGIVPPTSRSPAGYRRYDRAAAARLELVRTLRDLGLDLPTIRRVVARESSLPEVAAAHAEALEVHIRTLRLRQAVLRAVARRGSTPEEMELMHELAKLPEAGRRHLIGDFLAATFGGVDGDPAYAGAMVSMTPELPDDPAPEQVEAWVELAELSRDPDFRAALRRMIERHAADRAGEPGIRPDAAALARDLAAPALAAGVDPAGPEAEPYVAALLAASGLDRAGLADRLEAACDPRRERYLRLLAVINGWPPPESLAPALTWFGRALRAHAR